VPVYTPVTSDGPAHETNFVATVSNCRGRARHRSRSFEEIRRNPRPLSAWESRDAELPEVETVRASLARDLIGKKVKTACD